MYQTSRGFTLIELLVVVAIIALLAAILFPVYASAREKARAATCLSNYHEIALAIHMYAQDNDDKTPNDGSSFGGLIEDCQPYAHNTKIFICPDDSDYVHEGRPGTYRMPDLYQGKPLSCGWSDPYNPGHTTVSASTTLAYEAEHDIDKNHPTKITPTFRHSGGTQYLLFDGHAKWMKGQAPDADGD